MELTELFTALTKHRPDLRLAVDLSELSIHEDQLVRGLGRAPLTWPTARASFSTIATSRSKNAALTLM